MISTSQPSPAQPSLRPNGTPVWAVAAKTVIFMTAALPTADHWGQTRHPRHTLSSEICGGAIVCLARLERC